MKLFAIGYYVIVLAVILNPRSAEEPTKKAQEEDKICDLGQIYHAINSRNEAIIETYLTNETFMRRYRYVSPQSLLHAATDAEWPELIDNLLKKNQKPNARDWNGHAPLHVAVKIKCIECVKFLLEGGANPNAVNADGNTPLHLAVLHGNYEVLKAILEKGGSVLAMNNFGMNPLDYAAQCEMCLELFEKSGLIGRHIKNRSEQIYEAVEHRDLDQVRHFLADELFVQDYKYWSPEPLLHLSVRSEWPDMMNLLLFDEGVKPNARNWQGSTALHVAVEVKCVECVLTLTTKGVNVNATNARGDNALHKAVEAQSYEIMEVLVEKGGDVNAVNNDRKSVVTYAKSYRCSKCLSIFRKHNLIR